MEGKCKRESGGEEHEGEESKEHGFTHIVVVESMCLRAAVSNWGFVSPRRDI